MKIDFHVHSHFSSDALHSVEQLAAAAKAKGLDAIGISDHNTIAKKLGSSGARKARMSSPTSQLSSSGVLILYGTEVSTAQGHVQVFGTGKTYQKGIDAFELVRQVKKDGGITIVAHPFSLRPHALHSLATKVGATAIEKYNGRDFVHSWRARRMGISGTGGSDAHVMQEVGNAWTEIDCALNEDAILAAVAKGKIKAFYRPSIASIASRYAQKMRKIMFAGGKMSDFATGKL